MNPIQKSAFEAEITQAKALIGQGELVSGFAHLERAHVIGQAHVVPHVISHWLMLNVEMARHRPAAAFGQIVRILLGGLGSAMGKVPNGNTGGSDISMFERLPIAPELQDIIDGRTRGDSFTTGVPGPDGVDGRA